MNETPRIASRLRFPVMLCSLLACQSLLANAVDDLTPGHWLEIPNSKLRAVDPDIYGQSGKQALFDRNFMNIINSWNGGAYDTKRDRLIIWGGGHNDYPGNGIYTFDMNTLSWEMTRAPSTQSLFTDWQDGDAVHSDGSPVSRHTYDYLEYLPPPIDRFFSAGGGALWQGSFVDDNTYLFDFTSGQWEISQDDMPNPDVGSITGYDPIARKVWYHGGISTPNYLTAYDAMSRTWEIHGNATLEMYGNGFVSYLWTGAIDPVRRKFIAIGNVGNTPKPLPKGAVQVWDIDREGYSLFRLMITTGATEILEARNPGIVYDPASDRIIAWNGTTREVIPTDRRLDPEPYIDPADIYILDMDTAVWTRVSPAPGNTVTPTPATRNGTYGRFRYVPSKNVFVLVNSVDENVYVYRLSNKPAKTVPDTPAMPSAVVSTVQ